MADLRAGGTPAPDEEDPGRRAVVDPDGRPRRRIGVFGGTFDPPHVGHLVAAVRAAEQLDLDLVAFVVANIPWQKAGLRRVSDAQDRLDMVSAAIDGEAGLAVCDVEIRRGGESYTVDTLEALSAAAPHDEHVLIVGADAANALDTWRYPERLAVLCRIAVLDRPGVTLRLPDGFVAERVAIPQIDVDSSDLRRRVADGRSIRYLVPDAAVSIIEGRRLYRDVHDDDRQ